jgi:hypothetical protein
MALVGKNVFVKLYGTDRFTVAAFEGVLQNGNRDKWADTLLGDLESGDAALFFAVNPYHFLSGGPKDVDGSFGFGIAARSFEETSRVGDVLIIHATSITLSVQVGPSQGPR